MYAINKLNESSYNLGRPAQPGTTTTTVTHKMIVDLVNVHFILKDLIP